MQPVMRFFLVLYCSYGIRLAAALVNRNDHDDHIFNEASYAKNDVLRRDVAVIGGGSSGTYGAIKLLDLGKSVALVEQAAVLGGHQNTYIEPTTGTPIDYGVQAYWNISVVRDFFARFDIPITNYSFEGVSTIYADFKTGQTLPNLQPPTDYSAYATQLNKYPELLWSWQLPSPVPEDLLLPFGDFIKKYSLQNIAYSIYLFSAGIGNILTQLTVNMFKWFDDAYLDGLRGHNIVTAHHNNGELYSKALAELGPSALLSSTVIAAHRPQTPNSVRLVIQTPTGTKLILASQLLVSIPPLLSNMGPFALDARELALFSHFTYSAYYNGVVNNTGLAPGTRYINAGANTTYNIPDLPAVYSISPTAVPGIFLYWLGSPVDMSRDQVEAMMADTVRKLTNVTMGSGDFVAWSSHTPFKLVVSAEEIAGGFYDRWDQLQGYKNTWYTGAAIHSHGSGGLWNFTQALLPRIAEMVG